jgi:predicted SnoaL-like aldol condensation-catalyzing enzyme
MKTFLGLLGISILFACSAARAQEPVVGVTGAEADALFTDKDPQLNINKQAAYHIEKDLLEDNHWDLADKWLTPAYIQHNPNVVSGRDHVVQYFSAARKPSPITEHIAVGHFVTVLAEGDLVIVVSPREYKDPRDPSGAKTYTSTWFDMWRFVDGKANEHWDGAQLRYPNVPENIHGTKPN